MLHRHVSTAAQSGQAKIGVTTTPLEATTSHALSFNSHRPFCWSTTFLLQSADGQARYRQFSLRMYSTVARQLK
ncbi:hypothetical protein EYF80_039890 [Liparis tanakae]|uniref:Uncharacterized protein n=1 Tax=Liparis tanakae TaxID=230148 RepID=A0A4Z2G9K6_9TELE|nr:hypothetical protein EYF80_039890 [Liparis tanakae]